MKQTAQKLYNWDIPQRQSPAALFVILLKTAFGLIKSLWPVFLIWIFKDKKEGGFDVLWILIAFCAVAILATLIKFWFYKFHIADSNLHIQTGWIKKKKVSIPLKNIQAVHLEQNFWQQILHVAKLSVDSSGSENVEAKIDALPLEKAEIFRQVLLRESDKEEAESSNLLPVSQKTYHLDTSALIKLSLSANHLEAFFILLGLGFNLIDDVERALDVDGWAIMQSYTGNVLNQNSIFIYSVWAIGIALISILVSVIRTAIKFYNFKLTDNVAGWKITYGLFTRQQKFLPLSKMQVMNWRANWLRKKLDFWVLNAKSIGHNETKRKQHIHLPLTALRDVEQLAGNYMLLGDVKRGSLIEAVYWKRKVLFSAFPLAFIPALISSFWIGWQALWFVILFGYLVWYYYKWYSNFKWIANIDGIELFEGVWGDNYTLLNWKKIQQVELSQSYFQRPRELASVTFATAGGKVHLPYIQLSVARAITDQVLYLVESREEDWM